MIRPWHGGLYRASISFLNYHKPLFQQWKHNQSPSDVGSSPGLISDMIGQGPMNPLYGTHPHSTPRPEFSNRRYAIQSNRWNYDPVSPRVGQLSFQLEAFFRFHTASEQLSNRNFISKCPSEIFLKEISCPMDIARHPQKFENRGSLDS